MEQRSKLRAGLSTKKKQLRSKIGLLLSRPDPFFSTITLIPPFSLLSIMLYRMICPPLHLLKLIST